MISRPELLWFGPVAIVGLLVLNRLTRADLRDGPARKDSSQVLSAHNGPGAVDDVSRESAWRASRRMAEDRRLRDAPPRGASTQMVVAPAEPRAVDEVLEQWSREPADANASNELSDHLEEALNDLGVSGALQDLSCGTSLCRVRMQFPGLADAQKFSDEISFPERRKRLEVRPDEEGDGIVVDVIVSRSP